MERLGQVCEVRVVSEDPNLAVIEVKSSGDLLFRDRVGGVWLVSPIQVYLELLCGEDRANKEMAEHLRRQRIVFEPHQVTPTHVELLGVNGMATEHVNGHT